MKKLMDLLPHGSVASIAKKLKMTESKVNNTIYGKQYNKIIIAEIERRVSEALEQYNKDKAEAITNDWPNTLNRTPIDQKGNEGPEEDAHYPIWKPVDQ